MLLAISLSACEDTVINVPPAPTAPTPTETVTTQRVDFRVFGNATSARIRYSNAADGLTQVVSGLPYNASFTTTDTVIFLSLEVTPTAYPFSVTFPFLSAQIYVNGQLFREASSSEFLFNTLSVTGTWRK